MMTITTVEGPTIDELAENRAITAINKRRVLIAVGNLADHIAGYHVWTFGEFDPDCDDCNRRIEQVIERGMAL